jgi:hypothetical protein
MADVAVRRSTESSASLSVLVGCHLTQHLNQRWAGDAGRAIRPEHGPVYWQKAIEFEERQAQPRVVASE